MSKLPAFQFYPGDWLKDPAVRSLTLEARGLWIDMLCIMHESDRRGYLELNEKPVSFAQLSRMIGEKKTKISSLIGDLKSSGVFSETEAGVIYCRRMVSDERKRQLCTEAGHRGGNPTLKGGAKGAPKGSANPLPTPSSSSSSSEEEEQHPRFANANLPPSLGGAVFDLTATQLKNGNGHEVKRRRKATDYPADWREWWSLYPRHESQAAGYAKWQQLSTDERVAAFTGLQRWLPVLMARIAANGIDKGCPHEATWLSQRRWEVEPPNAEQYRGQSQSKEVQKIDLRRQKFLEGMQREQEYGKL